MPTSLSNLPVITLADDIRQALQQGNVLLQAEPGAGKSTGIPIALLLGDTLEGKLILLEPRRLAARSVAERLASHLGEKVGQRVGLRMRADTRVSSQTRLEVVTEGVLTRLLQSDPSLEGVALVIFDEFHERSLHADLGLALCIEVQQALRSDLRLLFMSATLEAEQISSRLQPLKQFHCSVRQHIVDTIWEGESNEPLPNRIVGVVLKALLDHTGDVLVFLPGVAEIRRTAALLQPRLASPVSLYSLHSGVSTTERIKATAPAIAGQRRVILATSIAETSITIDGVQVVVDAGLERRGRLDTATGAQRLETVMASQASATQRAGRAGRTAAGVCYRLWGATGHTRRPEHWQPEIRRADLAALFMELAVWGATGEHDLPWLEHPPLASLARAEELLVALGLFERGKLTTRGKLVASLPLHPRLGHMLAWAAGEGAIESARRLALLLDEQPRGPGEVDLEPLLNQALSPSQQRRAAQWDKLLPVTTVSSNSMSHAVVLAQAFPDWIAQRRPGEPGRFLLSCGAGAIINTDDPLAHCQWLAVAQLGGAGSQLRIFKALALDPEELEQVSPDKFHTVNHLDWDDKTQRVLAEHRLMLGCLVAHVRPMRDISADDKAKALLNGIRKRGISCLPWTDECREWQARVMRMGALSFVDKNSRFPQVDDESLLEHLDQWLMSWLLGISSMKAVQQLDLYKVLNSRLEYRQQILMDECLPRLYRVPSGSNIALSYRQPGNPVLSVRLQEMLGCTDNPSIARGHIPLKVELLSPARRPVQVTEDLANFWRNSYPAVKKELAGRYPKHVWPDDPVNAQPTAHAKRRK